MTDPSDETQPHPTAGAGASRAPDATGLDTGLDIGPGARPGQSVDPAPTASPATAGGPVLRADPDRPADSGWREPAWFPPRERDRTPSLIAMVVGLVLIGVGVWFFLDRTLGVDLPRLQWSTIWPVILIVIGGLIVLRSFRRRA